MWTWAFPGDAGGCGVSNRHGSIEFCKDFSDDYLVFRESKTPCFKDFKFETVCQLTGKNGQDRPEGGTWDRSGC